MHLTLGIREIPELASFFVAIENGPIVLSDFDKFSPEQVINDLSVAFGVHMAVSKYPDLIKLANHWMGIYPILGTGPFPSPLVPLNLREVPLGGSSFLPLLRA